MKKYGLLLAVLGCMILGSCATTGENWTLNKETGELECIQRVKLKGFGDREVKFQDKSQIESKSSKILPDLKIDVDDLKTD